MTSYLHTLAQTFAREVSHEELQTYAFVFPNRRAGLFFRKYLGQSISQPIFSPAILTINDCFEQLSDLKKEDPLRLLLRLWRIYDRLSHSGESLEQFLYWGKMMLSDFSEIDNHLIPNVRELLSTIRDLKEVDLKFDYLSERQRNAIEEFWGDFWGKKVEMKADMGERFLYIWQLLYPCYEALREELLKEQRAYDGLLHRHLLEHWDQLDESKLYPHYVFIGFNALTASEEELLIRLRDMGRADFYFDYSQPYLCDPLNRTTLFMEHNRATFPQHYPIQTEQQPARIEHISIPSTLGEAHEVYRILNELHPQGEQHELTRTAVVLPDERMLLNILNVIPEQIDRVNVTMGYPLSATPAYALLKIIRQMDERKTDAGYYHKDVETLLSHKYIHAKYPEECNRILDTVREKNIIYLSASELPVDVSHLRQLFEDIEESEESNIILSTLTQLEDTLSEQHYMIDDVHTQLMLLDFLLSVVTIPYAGEPLEGLQVMGVLETRALDFDNVIIIGFNDELYPGNSRSSSFIPYTLRRGFALPTPERQDAIFAYNFYRMISYAKQVYLITNSRSDDQHSGEASRYLSQLLYQYQTPVHQVVISPAGSTQQHTTRCIQKTGAVRTLLDEYTQGKRTFSPSALNAYMRCPMLYYWQNLMRIKPPKEVDDQMAENDFGTLLHALMQQLYEPYIGHEVGSADILQMIERVRDPHLVVNHPDWQRAGELEKIVLLEYAVQILRSYDLPLTPFDYLGSEEKSSYTLRLTDNRQVTLYGIIDRIDRVNGQKRVIDYKSGNAETEFEDIASLTDAENSKRNHYALQTLCYCLMHDRAAQPHIYSVRKVNDTASTAVHPKNGEAISNEMLQELEQGLVRLIEEILGPGTFVPTEDKRACENCTFATLCARQ